MRIERKFILGFAGLALCWGLIAQGQVREKAAEAVKKAIDPANKSAPGAKGTTKSTNAPPAKPAAPAAATDADEKAIRASAEAFTKLYNDHDAKGLGALFAPKAEVIDEDGNVTRGREAIQQSFADVFRVNPKASMEVDIESVRVLASSLAIEEGTARSKDAPDAAEEATTYVAIHAKQEGKWLLACVRDWYAAPAERTAHDHLEELSWLIGEWVEESPESTVHTECNWHDNGNFLIQEYHIRIGGKVAISGTNRIGWDAVAKQFRSWSFDSKGGHSTGLWIQEGDEWVVKTSGATADGQVASATNIYRPVDADTIGWRSTERVLAGEFRPGIDEIIIKRRPPLPGQ